MLVKEEGREKAREKRDVFSLDLNTVTESLLTVLSFKQPEQSIGMLTSQKSYGTIRYDTIQYDTRCYFNVRSKADISRLNLPHGTEN